jgi:Domain of unknown function (DUF6089)
MNTILLKSATLAMLFSAESAKLKAQLDLAKFEIGINAGTFIYEGDLAAARTGSYRTMKSALGIYVNRMISPLFSLRTNLSFGKLKGDDAKYSVPAYRQQRNFNFRSPVLEVSELLVADLLKNNRGMRSLGLSPYLFAGAGFSFLNIKRDWSRFNAEYFSTESNTLAGLAADAQHSLPRLIPVLPAGVGIRYAVSQKISINAETSYKFTFTDYLDGFSKAANPSQKDSYHSHSVGIVYQFVKTSSLKCPVFRY